MNFPIRKLNEELIDYNLSLRILFTILSVAIIMIAFDSLGSNGDPVGDALCKLIIIIMFDFMIISFIIFGNKTVKRYVLSY
ncbi:MAG: hypothetical protein O7C58_09115 [Rickettsia endosymbiont of Ixodes persulcatus]|nr:hypothetical protein [Rickettsia endosymbiont of Ixodes persulcatus]